MEFIDLSKENSYKSVYSGVFKIVIPKKLNIREMQPEKWCSGNTVLQCYFNGFEVPPTGRRGRKHGKSLKYAHFSEKKCVKIDF